MPARDAWPGKIRLFTDSKASIPSDTTPAATSTAWGMWLTPTGCSVGHGKSLSSTADRDSPAGTVVAAGDVRQEVRPDRRGDLRPGRLGTTCPQLLLLSGHPVRPGGGSTDPGSVDRLDGEAVITRHRQGHIKRPAGHRQVARHGAGQDGASGRHLQCRHPVTGNGRASGYRRRRPVGGRLDRSTGRTGHRRTDDGAAGKVYAVPLVSPVTTRLVAPAAAGWLRSTVVPVPL